MYLDILADYIQGIIYSNRIDVFAKNVYQNIKLIKLVGKIAKYNFLLHFLPILIVQFFEYLFGISLDLLFNLLVYPINFVSILFHLLHYMDLVNIVSIHASKTGISLPFLEIISLALTMSIYQIIIYLTTNLVNIILHERLYYLAIMINFVILTIYHAFYCYNNLWQYKKIEMGYRIDMHEKLWAFYLGYGTIATIIYLLINGPIILGCYNLYMVLIISLPFMLEPKYPSSTKHYPNYPSINLSFFSYLMASIVHLSKNICNSFKNYSH